MGFNIGRFFGGALSGALEGGASGGFVGALAGGVAGGLSGAFSGNGGSPERAATIGRTTQVGPVSTGAVPGRSLQFSGGGTFFPTSTAPIALGTLGRGAGRALTIFGNGFFGGNGNGQNPISAILAKAREATGGPVTRNKIIDAAKVCGLEIAASTFGIDVNEVCLVVVKGRTRRRRGVSAADIRRTKRTINFASKVRKDLKALAR